MKGGNDGGGDDGVHDGDGAHVSEPHIKLEEGKISFHHYPVWA